MPETFFLKLLTVIFHFSFNDCFDIVGCRLDALAFDDVPAGTTEGATDWLTAAAPSPDRLVTGGNPCSPNVPTL